MTSSFQASSPNAAGPALFIAHFSYINYCTYYNYYCTYIYLYLFYFTLIIVLIILLIASVYLAITHFLFIYFALAHFLFLSFQASWKSFLVSHASGPALFIAHLYAIYLFILDCIYLSCIITFDWNENFEFWGSHRKDLFQIYQNMPYFVLNQFIGFFLQYFFLLLFPK